MKHPKVNSEKNSYRIALVHELFEILVSSIPLIAPPILFILWIYRVGICISYGLPIFYSSLNIMRFLPVLFFSVLLICTGVLIPDASPIIVTIANNSQRRKKKKYIRLLKKQARFHPICSVIPSVFLSLLSFAILLCEIANIGEGEYPLFFKNRYSDEAFFVLVFAVVGIIISLTVIYVMINQKTKWEQWEEKLSRHTSIRVKPVIFRIPYVRSVLSWKRMFIFTVTLFFTSLFAVTMYSAFLNSYFKTGYYLLSFENIQYAIVLDTDDYYIGEPVEITQLENERKLTIHTDAYVYLDKAENPMVVQKDTFDSVTILYK